MSEQKEQQSLRWSIILAITIVIAGVSGFLVVNRKEFFPDMYNSQYQEHHADTLRIDSLKSNAAPQH